MARLSLRQLVSAFSSFKRNGSGTRAERRAPGSELPERQVDELLYIEFAKELRRVAEMGIEGNAM